MKSKFTQRRYRAPKRSSCAMCKPQQRGWADKKTPGDDEVLLSGNELKDTGLPKPSIIKLSKIFTIHQGLIRKKLGHVSDPTFQNILHKLLRSMQ